MYVLFLIWIYSGHGISTVKVQEYSTMKECEVAGQISVGQKFNEPERFKCILIPFPNRFAEKP